MQRPSACRSAPSSNATCRAALNRSERCAVLHSTWRGLFLEVFLKHFLGRKHPKGHEGEATKTQPCLPECQVLRPSSSLRRPSPRRRASEIPRADLLPHLQQPAPYVISPPWSTHVLPPPPLENSESTNYVRTRSLSESKRRFHRPRSAEKDRT